MPQNFQLCLNLCKQWECDSHRCLHWPWTADRTIAQGPVWKWSENLLCLYDITTLSLAPAVCFLGLFNGNFESP